VEGEAPFPLYLKSEVVMKHKEAFLATAEDVGTSTTVTNVTDFVSVEIWVSRLGMHPVCAITVTFTRVTGDSSDVNFNIEASTDDKATWDSAVYTELNVATNVAADSNVVTKTFQVNIYGITHLRLGSIVNDSSTIALTACNASVSVRN
jgi:hypothetical protein